MRSFGADLELVRPALQRVCLEAGRVLAEPGDEIRTVYFPTEGLISKLVVFESGDEIEYLLVGRSGASGALAALGLTTTRLRHVCTLHTQAWSIATCRLAEAAAKSPVIAAALKRCCDAQIAYGIRIGACNACHSVEQRLARWLLNCTDVLGCEHVVMSQESVAKALGAQRSSISPALQRLQAESLVALGRSRVRILDRVGLGERACECYRAAGAGGHPPAPAPPSLAGA